MKEQNNDSRVQQVLPGPDCVLRAAGTSSHGLCVKGTQADKETAAQEARTSQGHMPAKLGFGPRLCCSLHISHTQKSPQTPHPSHAHAHVLSGGRDTRRGLAELEDAHLRIGGVRPGGTRAPSHQSGQGQPPPHPYPSLAPTAPACSAGPSPPEVRQPGVTILSWSRKELEPLEYFSCDPVAVGNVQL